MMYTFMKKRAKGEHLQYAPNLTTCYQAFKITLMTNATDETNLA